MAQTTRAIVVGVDGYAFRPLGSAVNDALAVRDALVQPLPGEPHGLADAADVRLFVAPAAGTAPPADSQPATREAILDALEAYYDGSALADRLVFYFAGHGMSASPDGRVRESLILPVDASSPTDGRNMICLDELLRLFEERGPMQQLWLIDACRDMPYQKRPRGYAIEWNEQVAQGQRAQVAIFAVAPGGEAPSERGGHGRFTTHLLAGLRGQGRAAEYVRGRGYAVTAQSLHAYIAHRIDAGLGDWDEWTRAVQRPDIRPHGPLLAPLRDLPVPPPSEFTVELQPPQAIGAVEVALEVQAGLPVPGWPPRAPPAQYELRASLRPGMDEQGWLEPRPALSVVDLREEHSATIEVPYAPTLRGGEIHFLSGSGDTFSSSMRRGTAGASAGAMGDPVQAPVALPAADDSGATALVTTERRAADAPDAEATLVVESGDSAAQVQLRQLEHPWAVRDREPPNHPLRIDPGTWDVRIAIGDDIVSAGRVRLAAGETRVLSSPAQITPALAGLLTPAIVAGSRSTLMPSESIGPMQGAILPTLLPLLGLVPFDQGGILLHQFRHLQIPQLGDLPDAPAAGTQRIVAVALEGSKTPRTWPRLDRGSLVWSSPDDRVSIHRADPADGSPSLRVRLPGCWVDIAAPGLASGVTVVALIAWPDGRVQSSVGLYRLPLGRFWPQPWGDAELPPGRLARALALAAPLFRSGADLRDYPAGVLGNFAHAKWIDPVLGALAFHSCRRVIARHGPATDPAAMDSLRALRDTIRTHMAQFFGALPDSRIIAATDDEPARERAQMDALLDDASFGQPALTASLANLAAAAIARRSIDHPVVDRFERIEPGQVFNQVVTTAS